MARLSDDQVRERFGDHPLQAVWEAPLGFWCDHCGQMHQRAHAVMAVDGTGELLLVSFAASEGMIAAGMDLEAARALLRDLSAAVEQLAASPTHVRPGRPGQATGKGGLHA